MPSAESNRVERFFNRIKQCRRVATCCDKLAANYLALSSLHPSGFGLAAREIAHAVASFAQAEPTAILRAHGRFPPLLANS
jgi:hypothetical protein